VISFHLLVVAETAIVSWKIFAADQALDRFFDSA